MAAESSSPDDKPEREAAAKPRAPAAATKASPKTPIQSIAAREEIKAVARKFADSPVQNHDPGVWGVLTAISKQARLRPQGMNIILNGNEHFIGRLVENSRFQIGDIAISANHCRIFREKPYDEMSPDSYIPVFLKDTSTNGTFLNWKKLRKHSPESRLCHGDIISFVAPPHEDTAYAFVYREVCKSICPVNGATLKRKTEDCGSESKRIKGIGIGSTDGPVSLDDIRRLQRSNMELRTELKSHVVMVENLRTENRVLVASHENELKDVRGSVTSSFRDQIEKMQSTIEIKQKELDEICAVSAELRNSIKDLNEKVSAMMQSRADADEIINNQKARMSELEAQLDEEKIQRQEEKTNAAIDLKTALQKAQAEAREEMTRQTDEYFKQNREQTDRINKLQETEKEIRMQMDMWISKLDDSRENLNMSQKKVRQLEAQIEEQQLASENSRKRLESTESEMKRLKKELENEKVAREEAWAKVSALEIEIAAAMHELSIEKQRFQGARERVILRETQLRAFYSTTEEISSLFAKQQEQLKAMQKTLEDEENYENTSAGFNPNTSSYDNNLMNIHREDENCGKTSSPKEVCFPNASKHVRIVSITSSEDNDDASLTEKHDCDETGSHEGDNNTQDMECTSAGMSNKAFGSEIDGIGTAPLPEGEPLCTEQVPETESPMVEGVDGHNISNEAGETVPLDDGGQVQDDTEKPARSVERNCHDSDVRLEDTEPDTIKTTDLLTSELPGSWANSTAPSAHGENDSPDYGCGTHCPQDDAVAAMPNASDGRAQGEQNNQTDRWALNEMIGIVAPELKDRFHTGHEKDESMSDAETEEGSNHSDDHGDDHDNAYDSTHDIDDDDDLDDSCS